MNREILLAYRLCDLHCPALNVPPESRVGNLSSQRRGAGAVSPVSVQHQHIVFFPLHVMLRLQLRAGQSGKVPANRMASSPPSEFEMPATGVIEPFPLPPHPSTPPYSSLLQTMRLLLVLEKARTGAALLCM